MCNRSIKKCTRLSRIIFQLIQITDFANENAQLFLQLIAVHIADFTYQAIQKMLLNFAGFTSHFYHGKSCRNCHKVGVKKKKKQKRSIYRYLHCISSDVSISEEIFVT